LTIIVYLKAPLRSDIDNYAKPIIDCCVKKGLIRDDRYIYMLRLEKRKSPEEGFRVEIDNYSSDIT
jgi:Holliday junction resolvase RusA-like endonuclease